MKDNQNLPTEISDTNILRRVQVKETNKKAQDIGWKDVLGLLSTSAAIFYFAGWVYEANWYGFFGLEVAQFSITVGKNNDSGCTRNFFTGCKHYNRYHYYAFV